MFELEFIPAAIALGAVCIATFTDLRKRIIPNKLTFPLIVTGVLFYFLLGIYRGDIVVVLSGAVGGALAFVIGYAMWLTGGWAGGDVKLFTAFGALLPRFSPFCVQAPYSTNGLFFSITILINSILIVLPILLLYAVISRIRSRGAFYKIVKITELKEGDIPAEIIYERNGKIGRHKSRFGRKPKWNKTFTNPNRAAGLTRYQVGKLKQLVRVRKLKNVIKIKRGIPFAPALGAGLFIAVFYGDLYWRFILALWGA